MTADTPFKLQQVVIPSLTCNNPPEHYFRLNLPHPVTGQQQPFSTYSPGELSNLLLDVQYGLYLSGTRLPGAQLAFDTLFGALSLWTWRGHCGIGDIYFQCAVVGQGILRFFHRDAEGQRHLLMEQPFASSGEVLQLSLPALPDTGVVYPEFEIHNDLFHLHDCHFYTLSPARRVGKVTLVITTFKREAYLERNLKQIEGSLFPEYQGRLEVLVIDNGQTLPAGTRGAINIVPNRNYGGAGGFTRGVIEALHSEQPPTHVLFCDDDVELEPEAIARAVNVASFLDDKAILGGAMLSLSARDVLYELGGTRDLVNFIPGKRALPLSHPTVVSQYDAPLTSAYFAWWFCMLPLQAFRDHGLPMPYFVRGDDVEIGERLAKAGYRLVSLLGCVVHHEDFSNKNTPTAWFYQTRNQFITALINDSHERIHLVFSGLILTYQLYLMYNKAAYAEAIFLALDEALRGPEALVEIGSDAKHRQINEQLAKVDTGAMSGPEAVAHRFAPYQAKLVAELDQLKQRYVTHVQIFRSEDFWSNFLGLAPFTNHPA